MSTLSLLMICITGIIIISLVVYVMYVLDQAGVFDSVSDDVISYMDRNNIHDKYE